MLTVLLQSLLLASAGILSVGSITLVILLLVSDRGWKNGLAYTLGYVSAYTLIGISTVLLGYETSENRTAEPSITSAVLLIVFGVLLLWFAFRNWRKSTAESSTEPRFFAIVNTITPIKAFGFGALFSFINFKNLTLFLTALSAVILSNLLIAEKIFITLLVVFVFCLSVIIPVFIYITFPRRADSLLKGIKESVEKHSHAISIWMPFLFGMLFIIRGITKLL